MSPRKILEVAERVEARTLLEYRTTYDQARLAYLDRQLVRACALRCCCWVKAEGLDLLSVLRREPDKN